ncbi:MAG: ABC transporter permease [Peptococcaceae bacterium]|jgi:spermidine/putrescine transport system permease protein|nr:ABC transporter permease [Peptococcaceae bacterium]
MALFTVVPILLVAYYSLSATGLGFRLTLTHFARVFEPLYLAVLWRSIQLALVSTLICFLLGYPVAMILAGSPMRRQFSLIVLFVVPMWMNFLARTYAWMTLLEKNGLINKLLGLFGVEPLNMLYTSGAVVLGMVYNYLPFMVFPIFTVLRKMDPSLLEASGDLGASAHQTFLKVIFPISLPGVLSGVTMVFMPSVTTFVISQLLGGGQFTLIGNLIEQQYLRAYDWGFGSALSIILMIVILLSMGLMSRGNAQEEMGGLL